MANTNHNLSHILAICGALSPAEIKMAGKYISLFEGPKQQRLPKLPVSSGIHPKGGVSLKFFQTILKYRRVKKEISLNDFIAQSFNSNQVRNLGSRVLKKLHDFLLFELNIRRSTTESRHVALQYLQRNISLLEFLLVRRVFLHFEEHANKLLGIAVKFELYSEACSIIRMQLSWLVGRITINEFDKTIRRYNQYKYLADNINEVNLFVYSLQVRFNRKVKDSDIIEYLKVELPRFQKLEKSINSDTWSLSFCTVLLEYYHQIADFSQADKVCFKQLEIYSRSKFLSTKNRMGGAYLQLANNNLFNNKFDQSLAYVENSITYFKLGYLNYVNACDVKLYNLIYLGKYHDAIRLTEQILDFNSVKSSDFYHAKWEYFRTVCLFYLGRYKDAFLNLSQSYALSEDKEGWGINIRLLSIMIQIDMLEYQGVEFELDTFRKQLQKHKKDIHSRYFLILRILNHLCKNEYQLIKSNILYRKLISAPEYRWKIKSPELVRFEDWIVKYIDVKQ